MTFQGLSTRAALGFAQHKLNYASDVAEDKGAARAASVSSAVHESGFESESGFRDAFQRLFGAPPSQLRTKDCVYVSTLPSPVGLLITAATKNGVCLLEFADRKALLTQAAALKRWFDQPIVPGTNERLEELQAELDEYFAKTREAFSVPLDIRGTPFQRRVWTACSRSPTAKRAPTATSRSRSTIPAPCAPWAGRTV